MKRLKRLLWIPLLFLCSTLWAADSCEPIQLARMNPYIAGAGVAAVSCTTQVAPTDTETPVASLSIGSDSTNVYRSTAITAGADAGAICKICINIKSSTGTAPSINLVGFYLFADDGGTPPLPSGSALATYTTGTLSLSGLTGTYEWRCLTTASPYTIVNGTIYHVVVGVDGTDGTNQVAWGNDATCATESVGKDANGVPPFTTSVTNSCQGVQLYK